PEVPRRECLDQFARVKVAVVGGGLGGLLAARARARWGATGTGYEARAQAGGRVPSGTTVAKGRATEAGGELTGAIPTRWGALAKEDGISLISRMSGDLYRGQQLQQRLILDKLLTPDELAALEKQLGELLQRIAEFARDRIRSGNESRPWVQPDLAPFDRMSV